MSSPFALPADEGAAHAALVARTLRIEPALWAAVVIDCGAAPRDGDAGARLGALAAAYGRRAPHAAPLPAHASADCEVCGGGLRAAWARAPGPLVYGRCARCGHGQLLSGGAGEAYADAGYFERRDAGGAGYDDYAREAAYREAKGARLVAAIGERTGLGPERLRLVEVGSGYGYTLAAAARGGARAAGVDVNPHAAAEARARTGVPTFTGTLARALETAGSGVEPAGADVVLYQFVLEHVPALAAELAAAARALRPGGWLALLVPSIEATELEVFGASYRSFRADHLRLFSRASLARALGAAGFAAPAVESGCNLWLLRGLLADGELERLHADGRGPDLFALSQRSPP